MEKSNQLIEGKVVTQNVRFLSYVSMFTDMASEMLVPISGIFMKNIVGLNFFFIGVLEGAIEAVAGLLKPYFGALSDRLQKRVPFITWGYTLSAISKPLMSVISNGFVLFFVRALDRLGKGMRTGARDAMLHEESLPGTKATVFGFHRSFDTLGAVFGPIISFAFLYLAALTIKEEKDRFDLLFIFAFVPGILAIICTLFLRESKTAVYTPQYKTRLRDSFGYWKDGPVHFKRLLNGFVLFSLFNSTDQFLLLKMKTEGLSTNQVIFNYVLYNTVFAFLAYPIGVLADKLGFRKIVIMGFLLFTIVYAGFAFNKNTIVFSALMIIYGLFAATIDGTAKAWIGKLVPEEDTGKAVGTFAGIQSLCALVAGALGGALWMFSDSQAMGKYVNISFLITAIASIFAALYFIFVKVYDNPQASSFDRSSLKI